MWQYIQNVLVLSWMIKNVVEKTQMTEKNTGSSINKMKNWHRNDVPYDDCYMIS